MKKYKYKYKLNMLEPGWIMIKVIGIFIGISIVFDIIGLIQLCYLFRILAALIGIILWILLIVEGHQDKVLNEDAIKERRRNGKN